MSSNNINLVTNEYDDGVVCFGPVTESQIQRYNRLPRRTVLPSDFELSQSVIEHDEDKENDQSTALNGSMENTTTGIDNTINNTTRSINDFDEEKDEIETIELKQSITIDSNSSFSSPCISKCIPNAKFMDTELLNRYIRRGSISSNDSSLSDDPNKSSFKDETISFIDAEEAELMQKNSVYNETSSGENSVSSVIEHNASIQQQNVSNDSNNICTLIHCDQKDDTDLSIGSDSELGDISEDSIIAEEYSITPGKQRLFDLRPTKQSFRAKTLVPSAPFMDRIEETTTPVVPKVFNSPSILKDTRRSDTKDNSDVSLYAVPFNQTSNECDFETTNCIKETEKPINLMECEITEELLVSENVKDIDSVDKSVDKIFDETTHTIKLSTDSTSMNFEKSFNTTDQNTFNNTDNVIFDNRQMMNIMSHITIPSSDVNDHNNEENSVVTEVDIKSTNTTIVDKILDDTMYTNKLSTNSNSIDCNKSLNETYQIENTLNDSEPKFDNEMSLNIISNKTVPTEVNDFIDKDNSMAMDVDIQSTNTSVVDNIVEETMHSYTLSTDNNSMDFNRFIKKTVQMDKTLNDAELNFGSKKSMSIITNLTIPTEVNDICNHIEEDMAMEVDIQSTNTSVVDGIFDETLYMNKLSTNSNNMDFNKSLNKTNKIENSLNSPEPKSDHEISIDILSNINIPTSDTNEENSIADEMYIKSTNTSVVDKIVDETLYTNRVSTNTEIIDCNKYLNETNQIKNTLNVSEPKFDNEMSLNIISGVAILTSDVNDHNNEENSFAIEVDTNSTNTSVVDEIIDETLYTNRVSINTEITECNKSSNETNQIKNTLNDSEPKFDNEISLNIISDITIPTSDVNVNNDEENSFVAEIETLYTIRVSTNIESTDCNKSSNETNVIKNTLNDSETKFDSEMSLNIISDVAIPTSNDNDEVNLTATEIDTISTNTSVEDKMVSEKINMNMLSTNSKIMDFNKSTNESDQVIKTMNDSEHKFDSEMSMNTIFNISIQTEVNVDAKNSIAKEVVIKSTNTSVVDKIFDETMDTNKISTNTKIIDFNEISLNIISDITIPTSDVNVNNDEENSIAMEVNTNSTNTTLVDKIFDETLYTNRVSTNTEIMDCNKSLNLTDQIKNTLKDSEINFESETSLNIISNITYPTTDANDHNDENNSNSIDADTTSTNTSIVDKILYDTMRSNKRSTNSRIIDLNKSLNDTESPSNDTEPRFVNNIQNSTFSAINVDDKLHLSMLDNKEVNITCNTSLEDPSCKMRQYLDFEQAVNEMCHNITSASGPDRQFNKSKYDDQALENLIEQTLSTNTLNLANENENFSNYDGSNLSVIVENKTLEETSCDDMEQNEYFENPKSESIVNEIKDDDMLKKSTDVNKTESVIALKSEVVTANAQGDNTKIETNEDISMKCTVKDSELVKNMNETIHNESSIFNTDELLKVDHDAFSKMDDISTKQILVPENSNEIHLNQNTLEVKNCYQINLNDISKLTDFKVIPGIENIHKNCIDQDELLTNDPQQELLDTTKSINNSLEEFKNLEQMFNFGDGQKETKFDDKTPPRTQKLLDFSIVQQTPTSGNPAKKQKLLNFSIVDQTPISKSIQNTSPKKNEINKPSLIDFSSVDEINFKHLQNDSNDYSSNNLSSISAPGEEFYSDESNKTNTSNFSNSTFNQTITDSNLNMSTYSCASRKAQNNIAEINNVEPAVLINKQIATDSPSNSLNKTTEQIEYLEENITRTIESKEKTFCDVQSVAEASTKAVKLLSNNTFNKNMESSELKEDTNKQLCLNSNECATMDFSIIEQGTLENVEFKTNGHNVCNFIKMSYVSKSNEQLNQLTATNSDSSSDEINNTTQDFEQSTFSHNINTELLTDIQMNDVSLLTESPEKSSIVDSFHSIELDHVQEVNKRKIETTHEYDNNEKKMKVESEGLKTPMSMLYKIKNMFRSSEKHLSCVNNTKENNLKSDKCYQKLNFGQFQENINDCTKPMSLKKTEVLSKSKIPCKVTDRSLMKNDELHYSSQSSLNDSIKQKKTIPKFTGLPVLSDVSNSSSRKCTESRIPSKFQK